MSPWAERTISLSKELARTHDEWQLRVHKIDANVEYDLDEMVKAFSSEYAKDLAAANSASMEIHSLLYELWKSSGQCLFCNLSPDDLCENSRQIASSYERLASENLYMSNESVVRDGLSASIALLNSEYGTAALQIVQEFVDFDRDYSISHVPIWRRLENATLIQAEMTKWNQADYSHLVFDGAAGRLTSSSGTAVKSPIRPSMFSCSQGLTVTTSNRGD